MKLWKISERCRRYSNLNTVTDDGMVREEDSITALKVPVKVADDISIEAMPRRIFANAHTYHINSISVNSDGCTYLSADDLRVNLWDLERTDQSFSILDDLKFVTFVLSTLSLSHPPPSSSSPPSHFLFFLLPFLFNPLSFSLLPSPVSSTFLTSLSLSYPKVFLLHPSISPVFLNLPSQTLLISSLPTWKS